ncbi:MAG: agmatinase [Inconstantimicrobium porci]|uniref:agmatinase n=1 Tax=Inconstantimicrobium porci TaxID=2652291 RepID=UPI002A91B0A3|nr:agmatinase [Inconstantimicrobium porci]MDY5910912.1 agmatinase [Inconstantimicrobium porci]
MNNNVEVFIGCESNYEDSNVVLFGAPFDGTTSYRPGTRFGSKAIRSESFGIETYSPYQDKDLEDYKIFDYGDLELCFGNTERVLKDIEEQADTIFNDEKIPGMIGGEHLVTLGAVRAAVKKYPDLNIIHFDAHTDLREEYLGETLSHATVMRRIHDIVGDNKIHQFGIRSGERKEFYWAKEHTNLNKFNFNGLEEAVRLLQGKPVYFTIDLDVLDPSEFCGTGTPEAGGVSFTELLNAIIEVGKLNIVGFDMVELSPIYDQSGASTAIACKILRELLLSIQ